MGLQLSWERTVCSFCPQGLLLIISYSFRVELPLHTVIWARSSVWESVRFASICVHIDERKLARNFGGKLLRKLSKLQIIKSRFLF